MRRNTRFDYHIHSRYDDGYANCQQIVETAIHLGMEGIGFSSHWPLPYDNDWCMSNSAVQQYLQEAWTIKQLYADVIDVWVGIEADYIFRDKLGRKAFLQKTQLLDYIIGAVHCFYNSNEDKLIYYDGSIEDRKETLDYFESSQRFCASYYSSVCNLVNKYEPDIIAHLDIVKKNNHKDHLFYENSGWYRKMIFNTLDSIEKTSTIMEVNLGGINRGYTNEPYPSFWILRECAKRDIPIVINSDAHDLKGLQIDFSGLIKELKLIGYNGQMKLISGKWEKSYF